MSLLGLVLLLALPGVAQAAAFHWNRALRLEPVQNGGLDAVSCANSRFCVAVDASGHVTQTTRPLGGNGSWSAPARIDTSGSLTGISCPTTTFCAAVDDSGAVLTSTQPVRGGRSWSRPVRIDTVQAAGGGYAGLAAISCPTAKLCVAVDSAPHANVLYSSNPTGGKGAWQTIALAGPATSISCPATSLCVIGGTQRYVSTNPLSPTGWKASGALTGGVYQSVDCVGTTLCIGVGFSNDSPGLASATTTPTGSWSEPVSVAANPPAIGSGLVDTVGCTRGYCVALDGADNAYVTRSPTQGLWGSAAAIRSKSASQATAISCTSGICVVVDSAGVETTGQLR